MIGAQTWLAKNTNKKKTEEIKWNAHLEEGKGRKLEGELTVKDYSKLKKIFVLRGNLTKLRITNCPQLTSLVCGQNQLTNLEIINCPQLTELSCEINKLVDLDCSMLNNLVEIDCQSNLLANISLPIHQNKLEKLDLSENNFPEQNLAFLQKAINLKELRIGNLDEEKIKAGIYNRFCGSLKFLKSMKQLESISIHNTNISEGLEYLPFSLEKISCEASLLLEAGCQNIKKLLVIYDNSYQDWRKANEEIIKKSAAKIEGISLALQKPQIKLEKQVDDQKNRIAALEEELAKEKNNNNKLNNDLENVQEEAEQEITNLTSLFSDLEKQLKGLQDQLYQKNEQEKRLEDLQIENENYNIANSLIREKYEETRKENKQLREKLQNLIQSNEQKFEANIHLISKTANKYH